MRADVPTGSVCSGYGGLDLAIKRVIRAARPVWVAEYEPPTAKVPNPVQGAARILAHRFPGVPNLGDITVVPWGTVPRAKIIHGGTPCQDVSHAGARKGMRDGTRSGIWSSMVEAIIEHRPTLVVWENVLGALSADADSDMEPCPVCLGDERESHLRALGRVVGDLSEIGYDAVWQVVSASSVGAPHRRERVFVVAWPVTDPRDNGRKTGFERRRPGQAGIQRRDVAGSFSGVGPAADASDALRARLAADGAGHVEPKVTPARSDRVDPVADAEGDGRDEGRPESAGVVGGFDASVSGSGDAPHAEGDQGGQRDRDGGVTADADGDAVRLESEPIPGGHRSTKSGRPVSDADSKRREPVESGVREGEPHATGSGDIRWGDFTGAIRRWEHALGRVAPAPTAPTARGGMALSPAFVEWMMGLPEGWVTDPAIWTGLSKSAARNAQLKALGNGVVPQQAAAAIGWLLQFAPAWVRADLGLPA